MTIEYSQSAKSRVERYLDAVRERLKASGSVDAREVMFDLRTHIERELSERDQPVSEEAAAAVLDRLGPPEDFVEEGDMSWWRKIVLRLRSGPEDWRLAYATVGSLALGVILGWVFGDTHRSAYYSSHQFNGAVFLAFGAISFLLARAALSAQRGAMAAGQKWLLYPPLVVVYLLFIVALLIGLPLAAGGGAFCASMVSLHGQAAAPWPGYYPPVISELGIHPERGGHLDDRAGLLAVWAGVVIAGLWWTVLGVLLRRERPLRALDTLFTPLHRRMSRIWSTVAVSLGVLLIILGAAAAIVAIRWGHVYF